MSDYPDKVNAIEKQIRVFNIKPISFTQTGKAVCNARFSLTTKLDDEFHSVWCELTAWDDAAHVLADCDHGDEVIIREGRLGAKAFHGREGLVVEPQVNANVVERLSASGGKRAGTNAPTSTVPDDDDVPF